MASMTAAGDRWIYYFKNNEVKDEFNARGLAEVRNQLVFDGLNDKERYAYKQYEKDLLSQKSALFTARIEGIAEGEQIGLQKGEEITKLDCCSCFILMQLFAISVRFYFLQTWRFYRFKNFSLHGLLSLHLVVHFRYIIHLRVNL
jgi:hypothetical protein